MKNKNKRFVENILNSALKIPNKHKFMKNIFISIFAITTVITASTYGNTVASINFESTEGYLLGNIAGQPSSDLNPWTVTRGTGNIVSTHAASGNNSLELAYSGGATIAMKTYNAIIPENTPIVEVSFDYLMTATSSFAAAPLTLYDKGTAFAKIYFQNSGGENSIGMTTALNTYAATGTNWVQNEWYHIILQFDLLEDTYRVSVNGGAYTDSVIIKALATGSPNYNVTVNSFNTLQVQGANSSLNPSYFDNFQVVAIPEPNITWLLILSVAGFAAFRRNHLA